MADYEYEDSFESSSESESESKEWDRQEGPISQSSKTEFVRSDLEQSLGEPLSQSLKQANSGSPKSSPMSRRKFRPHFKKPTGLGNIIKKRKKKVFGVSLQTAVYRSELGNDGIELPTIFRQCIDYLEENALEHEGVYRLAGVKSQIDGVKTLYDKESEVDLSNYDCNTVASLLKLYLRELPEPLVPLKLLPRLEAASRLDAPEMQLEMLLLVMEELPPVNKLLLSWLFVHMNHIADKANINKMGISNLVIVFSPTLQIPISLMHLLYNNRNSLFPNVEILKYERSSKSSKSFGLPDPNELETEEEITAELARLSDILEKLHTKVHSSDGKYDERDDYCWELQRVVTELKRKKKVQEQFSASKLGDEQEFMKALILMAATLEAENDEIKDVNFALKECIRKEMKQIEEYEHEIKLYEARPRVETEEFL
ncbi:PREDICTED: ralA-binding protein 1-like isoform X2 [Amphimedon queenslandica]|nr:PREDICTED: ralA-binding protein 1-like isoform X2 [Amphimedon queenslandica]|eukprot:XP_019852507.1 PREDICTED: ralA-binding protein 1-like isoform X2 [Amphimedon queenslandica]